MLKVKIKSFEDAVQAAIENGKEDDAIVLDDKRLRKFDSVFGINRNWHGWSNMIDAQEENELDTHGQVINSYYYDGEFCIPFYCVEYAAEN